MGTENVGIDYASVLADLKARRDSLDATIAGIERLIGQNTTLTPGAGAAGFAGGSADVQSDTFFNMSIAEASKKFLAMRKKAQTTADIAEALEKGGMTHTSDNWGNTVGSVLNRMDTSGGEIIKIKRGTWGLAAWYPGRKRTIDKKGADDAGDAGADAAE